MLCNITECIDKHFFYNICLLGLSLYVHVWKLAPPQVKICHCTDMGCVPSASQVT